VTNAAGALWAIARRADDDIDGGGGGRAAVARAGAIAALVV